MFKDLDDTEFDTEFNDRLYDLFSPVKSGRFTEERRQLMEQATQFPWVDDPNVDLLIIPSRIHISGKSTPAAGVMGINEELLSERVPEKVRLAVAVHERTHLHVGSEIRQAIVSSHLDMDSFFHKVVLPAWMNGEVSLGYNRLYIQDKGWSGLYDKWFSKGDTHSDPAREAVSNFFLVLGKGLLVKVPHFGYVHLDLATRRWEEVSGKPDIPPEEQDKEDREGFIEKLMTGYEMAHYLHEGIRDATSHRVWADLWEIEEGFCNFVACGLLGVDLGELQRYARQDEGKLKLAQRFMGTGISPVQALSEVSSYQGLADFSRKAGLVK